MPDTTFRELEKGPSFEIYQGPQITQRIDWNAQAMRSIYAGQVGSECAAPLIRRWEQALRSRQPITMFHDFWDVTGLDPAFRNEISEWTKKNRAAFAAVHMLSNSKPVSAAIGVLSLAVPGLIHEYGKRPDYEPLWMRAGLPRNPALPKLPSKK